MKTILEGFTELELFKNSEDKEAREEDFKILDKIFTNNVYGNTGGYLVHNYKEFMGESEELGFAAAVKYGEVRIFKQSYSRPVDPEVDSELFQKLKKLGKCSAYRTSILYWWADSFCRLYGAEIEELYSPYVGISNMKNMAVRCGEITADDLYREILSGKIEFLIFPYICKRNEKTFETIQDLECYLIKFDENYVRRLKTMKRQKINDVMNSLKLFDDDNKRVKFRDK